MKKLFTMREALEREDLLGTILPGDTWRTWRTILIAAMGEPLTFWERRIFAKFTGGRKPPGKMVSELVAVAGRRAGKSRAASALACYLAGLCDHSDVQAIGETLRVLFLAKDQKQAGVCFGYVNGIFESIPLFRDMVANRTQDTILLNTGIALEVKAATSGGLRGFSCVAILADEAAHWTTDQSSANADTLVLDAVRPNLLTTGGPLLILSSPFARKGEVWNLYDQNFGSKGAADILVVHGTSLDFNKSLDKAVVDRALARNPIAARAEYLAEFRSDLEGYVSLDTLRACTGPLTEWQPLPGTEYCAGIDAAMGSGEDSLALAVSHYDPASSRVILDFIKEWRPPFSPTAVLKEVASHCRRYGITEIIGDRFAERFVAEMLFASAMRFRRSDRDTSGNFGELLPMLNSHEVVLPNPPAFIEQLASLQARPSSRGRTFYGHGGGSNAHDDMAAAAAIAITHCSLAVKSHVEWSVVGASWGPSKQASGFLSDMTAMTSHLIDGFTGPPEERQPDPVPVIYTPPPADPDAPSPSDPDYGRMVGIRNGVKVNGEPMSWAEIRNKVADEKQVMKRWA